MSNSHGALVVFGSGPGVGRSVAALFAQRGFEKVVLISRNADRLAEDGSFVRSVRAESSVHEVTADMGNLESVHSALDKVDQVLGGTSLECVFFNAARTGRSEILEFPPKDLENDLKISVVSLYSVAQWAVPKLLILASDEGRTPSLLVSSGMLAFDPFPAMFSLAASKAGQYSLVESLHKAFEPKGVHCGLIIIGGTVSDESKVTNARNIAEQTWEMFMQPRGKGELRVIMSDPAYSDHIKNRERQK